MSSSSEGSQGSRTAQGSGGRQVTDQEKEELTDVLTRAGLLHLKDRFLREKVFVLGSALRHSTI